MRVTNDFTSSLQVLKFLTAIRSWTTAIPSTTRNVSGASDSSNGTLSCVQLCSTSSFKRLMIVLLSTVGWAVPSGAKRTLLVFENSYIPMTSSRSMLSPEDRAITNSLAKSDVVAFKVSTSDYVHLHFFSSRYPCLLLHFCHFISQVVSLTYAFIDKLFVSLHAIFFCF